jgi:hypothetical protein
MATPQTCLLYPHLLAGTIEMSDNFQKIVGMWPACNELDLRQLNWRPNLIKVIAAVVYP